MKKTWMHRIALGAVVMALAIPMTVGAEPLDGRGPGGRSQQNNASRYAAATTPLDAAEQDALE